MPVRNYTKRETGGKIRECLHVFDCLYRVHFFTRVLGLLLPNQYFHLWKRFFKFNTLEALAAFKM
jgi:hypothetical protein